MKLLKAFVRTSRVNEVIQALRRSDAPGITVSRVHGVGYGYDPMLFSLAPSDYKRSLEVSKIEIVCCSEDAERLLQVLVASARTGSKGDGIVFVTPVEDAVKIRSGRQGADALCRDNR